MFFSTSLSLGLLLSAVAVNAAIYDVQVGANSTLTFSPDAISANSGDQVVFHFHQKNHTATQSSFANPCSQMPGGFNSGFNPVPANQTDNFPTFTITVNDTTPIWVFCDQAANTPSSHCGAGMVFAVNCGPDGSQNSFTDFRNAALAIGAELQAEASSTATTAASTSAAADQAVTTAAYGGVTIPAAPTESLVTVTVTVDSSSWTTVYSSYPGSPAPTPVSLTGTTHTVLVGNNGTLTYDPPFVMAEPRDTIVFEFHQKNHTATLSSFEAPCVANSATPIDSGFQPVAENVTSGFPTFSVTVNDTNPLWFFCQQHTPTGASHCGSGMVFAVNPVQTSARNFTAFQNLAVTLNGTNATGTTSSGTTNTSGAPNATITNGAASLGLNAALVLSSVLALMAALL